eukprot:742152-Pyramimonas_sp.AAC.1
MRATELRTKLTLPHDIAHNVVGARTHARTPARSRAFPPRATAIPSIEPGNPSIDPGNPSTELLVVFVIGLVGVSGE